MSDIDLMRDYVEARIAILKKSADFWKEEEVEEKYQEKMARIRELEMMQNVLDEMEWDS